MKKAKRFLAVLLVLALTAGILPATKASAEKVLQCDTAGPIYVQSGQSYTYRFSVYENFVPVFTVGNNRIIQITSIKTVKLENGKDYYVQIKAVGKMGQATGLYETLPGQGPSLNNIVTIGTTPPEQLKAGEKWGLFGIVDIGEYDALAITRSGVLEPVVVPYDRSRTFEEHADAFLSNTHVADFVDNSFQHGDSQFYTPVVTYTEKDGKYGLIIRDWRRSKSESYPWALNSVLSVFVYFLGHDAGESLWAWYDDYRTSNKTTPPANYGFTDSNPDGNTGTLTYKDGTQVDYDYQHGILTVLFHER